MKKVFVLLLLFIVACGGSSKETVVENIITTTTISENKSNLICINWTKQTDLNIEVLNTIDELFLPIYQDYSEANRIDINEIGVLIEQLNTVRKTQAEIESLPEYKTVESLIIEVAREWRKALEALKEAKINNDSATVNYFASTVRLQKQNLRKLNALYLALELCNSNFSAIQDNTTAIIPSAPTVDFNIVEIYNTKLGTDLCSDASDIDVTPEPCLKQYRDNLELVLSYAESLKTYITELNTYFESYPSAMTEEYTTLFQFINNEYQEVPETYGIVVKKYAERFGGVPTISLPIFSNPENLSVNCTVDGKFDYSENLKSVQLTYINNSGEIISFNTNDLQGFSKLLKNTGGTFSLFQSKVTNYLDESFEQSNNIENSFFVEHLFHRIVSINLPSEIGKGDVFQISMKIEPVVGSSVDSVRLTMIDPLSSTFANETTMTTKVFEDNTAIFFAHYLNSPKDYYKQDGTQSSPSEVYFYNDIGYYKLGIIDINSLGSNRYNGYYYNSRDASNGLSMPLASRCGQLDQYQINPLDYDELILKIKK